MSTTFTSTVLLAGLRQPGNEAAWQEFCARYEPLMFAFARRAGLQPDDARDVVQESLLVFVTRFRAGEYDREKGRLRAWLGGITFNKIREARRRRAHGALQGPEGPESTAFVNRIPDTDAELSALFEQEWQQMVLAECLRRVQTQVDQQTYEAFRLYALERWPAERVAAELGLTREAVYVHKSRVLRHLRELQALYVEDA